MFQVHPIALVRNDRVTPSDDHWDAVTSRIEFSPDVPADALLGLDAFSHVEVVYIFDRVEESAVQLGARHPRGNPAWPLTGIYAQRGKARPNRIGVGVASIEHVDPAARLLVVRSLDAIDGTPVLDVKPVMREFLPRGEVRQPAWATELMQEYWR